MVLVFSSLPIMSRRKTTMTSRVGFYVHFKPQNACIMGAKLHAETHQCT